MEQLTSTSHQVAYNATQTVRPRFGFETHWNQVTNPSGGNIISRTVNAAIAVFVNLAKAIVNATLWPLNKIHSLLFGKPANTITIEDDIEIQQDTVTVDIAESNQMNDETISEPVVVGSNRNWQNAGKAGLAVVAAFVAVATLSRGAQYFSATQNSFTGAIDNFVCGIPTSISNGASYVASGVASGAKSGVCTVTFGKYCP